MEHANPFNSLDARSEPSDDASSDSHEKKKSTNKSSRKFEVSHAQSRKEEVAGKGLFSLLDDSRPKIFEVPKKPEKPFSPVENNPIESPIEQETKSDSTESTVDPEVILPEERQTVAQNILEAEGAALQQELQEVDPDSDEAAEVANAASFIEEVSSRIENGEPASEELFDEALNDVLKDLGLELESVDGSQEALEDASTIEGAVDEDGDDSQEDDGTARASTSGGSGTARPSGGTGTGGAGAGGAGGGPAPGGGRPGTGGAGAGGGAGAPPPPPPPGGATGGGAGAAPPPGGAGMPFPAGPAGGPFGPMDGGMRPPTPVFIEAPRRRNGRRELLVGGLVGYLIGRRRGRIKTEKKLVPIQKSLERQVKDLNYQITDRELKIRQLTAENLQKDKAAQLAQQKQEQLKQQNTENQSSTLSVDLKERIEIAHKTEHKVDVEAKLKQTEKLAAMIVPVPERVQERRESEGTEVRNQQRSQQELLESAAKIRVGDTSLKQLLEQGKINPEDAEEAVELYLKGDSRYEKVLQKESLPTAQADTLETLQKKKPESPFDAPVAQQPALVVQEGRNPEYSPVAAMNSQLAELLEKNTQESKNRSAQLVMWSALAVVALLVVGLMLFLTA